jgi:hypothetical protein
MDEAETLRNLRSRIHAKVILRSLLFNGVQSGGAQKIKGAAMSPKAIDEARHQRRRENAGNGYGYSCGMCERPSARHRYLGQWLCCMCHVKAGYQPAEWHPECMAAAAALREAKR